MRLQRYITAPLLSILVTLITVGTLAGSGSTVYRQGDYLIKQIVVPGFDELPLDRKLYIYYLAQAIESGRDIIWKQLSHDGLDVRNLLEGLYKYAKYLSPTDRAAFEEYLFKIQKQHTLYNVNKNAKILPDKEITFDKLLNLAIRSDEQTAKSRKPTRYVAELERLRGIIFDPKVKPYFAITPALQAEQGLDIIADAGSNFYGPGVTDAMVKELPIEQREHFLSRPELDIKGNMFLRLNRIGGNHGNELKMVDHYLWLARKYANPQEQEIIDAERKVLRTGDPKDLQVAETLWAKYKTKDVDFRIGYIETYDDPLSIRGYWEGYITLTKQDPATKARHATVRSNADVFEEMMPVDPQYKKAPGFSPPEAESVYFVFVGGQVGESPPAGINLPNDDWIRENIGSKSVTAENIVADVSDKPIKMEAEKLRAFFASEYHSLIRATDTALSRSIQVEFHEILGHGSGRTREGVTEGSFGRIYNPLEEARAEVASLYHMMNYKLLRDMNIYPSTYSDEQAENFAKYTIIEFFTAQMQSYATRLSDETKEITQAHQLARQAMFNWVLADDVIKVVNSAKGIPQIHISDLAAVQKSLGNFWHEIQTMRSAGLVKEAEAFFAKWGAYTDLHRTWRETVLKEIDRQGLPKERLVLNPTMVPVVNSKGEITDIKMTYSNASKGLRGVVERQIKVTQRNRERTFDICESVLAGKQPRKRRPNKL